MLASSCPGCEADDARCDSSEDRFITGPLVVGASGNHPRPAGCSRCGLLGAPLGGAVGAFFGGVTCAGIASYDAMREARASTDRIGRARCVSDFINGSTLACRLKTLKGLTPFACKSWTSETERFTFGPILQTPGPKTT